MKKINAESTKIFCRLLQKMNAEGYLKIINEGYMPLSVEIIDDNIETPFGLAKLVSIAHYYKQNGDMMCDPEMVFLVVDNRKGETDYGGIYIYPQMYQQDSLGVFEESMVIKNRTLTACKHHWQDGHCGFANLWLKNILQQGFLK